MRAKVAPRAVKRIPIRSIRPSPLTVNSMAEERYRELLKDVRERPDAIAPILLRPIEGEVPFEVVCGNHRLKAFREVYGEHGTIPAIVDYGMTEDEARVVSYRENRVRGELDPVKEGELFKLEADRGLSYRRIAEKYGVDKAYVVRRISFLSLPSEVKELAGAPVHRLTAKHLEYLLKVEDPERQVELAKLVVERELSTRQLKAMIKKPPKRPEASEPEAEEAKPEVETRCALLKLYIPAAPGMRCLACNIPYSACVKAIAEKLEIGKKPPIRFEEAARAMLRAGESLDEIVARALEADYSMEDIAQYLRFMDVV